MSRHLLATLGAAIIAVVLPQSPQFGTRVDLIRLDVSVIDDKRRPVRGLTAADFTILEESKRQELQAFLEVNLPDEPERSAGWMRDTAPDVVSNTGVEEDRLVVIVMDDYSEIVAKDLWALRSAKEIGRGIVDRLGPRDLAAVVFTINVDANQEFTHDRERLLAAVDSFNPGTTVQRFASSAVLAHVCNVLGSVPDRRKVVIWVSTGDVAPGSAISSALRLAQRNNVNIYPIDPAGIRAPTVDSSPFGNSTTSSSGTPTLRDDMLRMNNLSAMRLQHDLLVAVASQTGGKAFQWNEFTKSLNQVFRETGSFYLLGYVSSNAVRDGKPRKLEVSVNRRGLRVNARSVNWPDVVPGEAPPPVPPPRAVEALAGLVPVRDVPLRLSAVPIATRFTPQVLIALSLPALAEDPDDADVILKAFTFDGTLIQTTRNSVPLGSGRLTSADSQVTFLERFDLPPGRYQIRAGVNLRKRQRSGSVYADVDVPDFGRDPLSMSGVSLSIPRVEAAVLPDATARALPLVPTTSRTFDRHATVTSFTQICQGNEGAIVSGFVSVAVRDGSDNLMFGRKDPIDVARFDQRLCAEHQFLLPLSKLEPGEYVLRIDAQAGKLTRGRQVRFVVR